MIGTCCSRVRSVPKTSVMRAPGSAHAARICSILRSRRSTNTGRAMCVSGPPNGSPYQCFLVSMSVWYHQPPDRGVSPIGISPYMRYWWMVPRESWMSWVPAASWVAQ